MDDIFSNGPRPFAATAQINYKNSYKRRLMDRSILHDITNQNFKGEVGAGVGTTVRVYVPGSVKIRDTRPDGGIVYQQVTDTYEDFTINQESYWALKFRPEDISYMPWDPRSEHFTNATDQLARHMERKFGADAINKVPAYNRGIAAGAKYANFDLGAVDAPVVLFKTQAQVDAATSVQHRDVAADFINKLGNVIKQGEGLAGSHVIVILPSPLKHHLETSELKYGGLMGERNLRLRGEVKFLGTMDDTITVIQDDLLYSAYGVIQKDASGRNIYPILALTKEAFTLMDDVVFRDNALKDVGNWDEHHRAKHVYDWALVWPQMTALAYVTLAEPAYTPAT